MEIRPILSALLRNKTAPILIALQVAISLAILANAIYIVNARVALSQRPSGMTDESSIFHIASRPPKPLPFNEALAQQDLSKQAIKAIPGVRSVAIINQMPMTLRGRGSAVSVNRSQTQATANTSFYYTPDSIINTLGLRLIEGRDFTPEDVQEIDPDASDVADKLVIITERLAKLAYPEATSVVGKTLLMGVGNDADEVRIIGVVERLQTIIADAGPRSEYSTIVPQRTTRNTRYAVRTEPGQRDRVMKEAEAVLRKMSTKPLIISNASVEKDRKDRYRNDLAMAWMLVAVSALLLIITASGIVGMTTLWVDQRRKQIGVRRALGARKFDILRYFITENILITTGGVACGLLLAMGLNQVLVSQLDMSKLPGAYMLAGALLFWLLGMIAVFAPAWRAASISPAIATRSV